jgi:hypothetical protein
MKKFLTPLTIASILIPSMVAAEDIESYVNRMIENAKEGNGTVIIENHSSVSTGGQVAGAGQTVTTGDVSASSHSETRINAGDQGGTVYVKTETKRNGEVEKSEEYTKQVSPGEPVRVHVSANADTEGSEVETEIQGEVMNEHSASSGESKEEGVTAIARFEAALASVPSFFKKVFSLVKFW